MVRHPIDYLEIIWQKPESTRKKIAAVMVIVLSSAIIGIWLMTFSLESSDLTASIKNNVPSEQLKESVSPFRIVWNTLKDIARSNPIFNLPAKTEEAK